MNKSTKIALYLFLFGILSIFAVFFTAPPVTYTKSDVLGLTSPVDLFIEPDTAKTPLVDYINLSQKSIWMTMYLLSDPEIIAALKEADNRGVDVKVILEEHPFGGSNLNRKIKPDLEASGISVKWGRSDFPFTHQKTLLIDDETLCVLNQNLTKSAFVGNREYNICENDPHDIADATAVFTADWEGQSYEGGVSNLLVSPISARPKLELFFNSTTTSLDLAVEVIDDPALLAIFSEKAKNLPVRILIPDLGDIAANSEPAATLLNSGVSVRTLKKPYLHAKAAIIDHEKVYLGSINMTTNSLDENREMGIILSEPSAVATIEQQFEVDWQSATPLLLPQ